MIFMHSFPGIKILSILEMTHTYTGVGNECFTCDQHLAPSLIVLHQRARVVGSGRGHPRELNPLISGPVEVVGGGDRVDARAAGHEGVGGVDLKKGGE